MSVIHGEDGFTPEDVQHFYDTVQSEGWSVFEKLLGKMAVSVALAALSDTEKVLRYAGDAARCSDFLGVRETIEDDLSEATKKDAD